MYKIYNPYTKEEITNKNVIEMYFLFQNHCNKFIKNYPTIIDMYPNNDDVYAYGNGKKMSNMIWYIQPLKDSVNLGFTKGADLAQQFKFIVGTGKNMRHIKFTDVNQIDFKKLDKVFEAAIKLINK